MEKKNKQTKQERLDAMHGKEKMKKEFTTIGIVVLVLVGFYFLMSNSNSQNFSSPNVKASQVPDGPIHWHPKLTILIDGINIKIPNEIGITPSRHFPMHTHDEGDGTLHLENSNPKANPDTFSLGYFFSLWKKPFNSTCILDKCTNIDGGILKFSVNGIENNEFEKYVFKGEEKILINYSSKK